MYRKYTLTSIFAFLVLVFFTFSGFAQSSTSKNGKRPTVGLVMSGGGAKGFAYIGMLKVFREAGLEFDYVAGSSMGSIVAGFYALGYHPDTMVKIVRAQDWDALLADKLDRKYLAYEEKEFANDFIISFPIAKKRVGLKAALYEGQEINLLLNRFYSPSYTETDFSKFQTPFLCIGTDLLTGEAIVLDQGYLPMAIRSSMSIPGFFSPTLYQGKYLVDGGVVNNYPVNEVKKKGMQIIVGADVQSGLKKNIEDLNSMTAVLDQVTSFHRVDANKEGYKQTDLYLHIKMKYGMMDFGKYDSIIAIGEYVARQNFDKIKALADSLNAIEYKPLKEYTAAPLDTIYVDDLVIRGNDRIPDVYFENLFEDLTHGRIAIEDLENAIRRAYGTKFFTHLYYEIESKDGKTNLVLDVKEADPGYISAGIHYDDNYNISLLLDGAFRNILGKRSKVFVDLVIGPNWRYRGMYILDNGPKPGFGAKLEGYSFRFNEYDKDEVVSKLTFSNHKVSVFARSIIKERISFRIGANFEYFQFKSEIKDELDSLSNFNAYGNVYFAFNADTRDKPYFATRGVKSELRVEYVTPLSRDWVQDLFSNALVFWLDYDQNIPFGKKFSFKPGLFLGGTIMQNYPSSSDQHPSAYQRPPAQHWFYMGGLAPNNYAHGFRAFTGVKFSQKYGMYMAIVRAKLQYELFSKFYITARADLGANEWYITDMVDANSLVFGYGGTMSYNSFIGPVEISLMGSNIYGFSAFVNLGFWF